MITRRSPSLTAANGAITVVGPGIFVAAMLAIDTSGRFVAFDHELLLHETLLRASGEMA